MRDDLPFGIVQTKFGVNSSGYEAASVLGPTKFKAFRSKRSGLT